MGRLRRQVNLGRRILEDFPFDRQLFVSVTAQWSFGLHFLREPLEEPAEYHSVHWCTSMVQEEDKAFCVIVCMGVS